MVPDSPGTAEGQWMLELARELQPFPRSLTGNGVRATLEALSHEIPMRRIEVPTGTRVLDWEVPREWNVREAYVSLESGDRLIDVQDSPLHLVGYSIPVRRTMSLEELRPHLHSLPERPDWIPYRTSYYCDSWGFCLSHRTLQDLPEARYEVVIDSTLEAGSLTYGECVIPGVSDREFLVSTHVCHPAMANDNLSGLVVATALARRLQDRGWTHTVRFLFLPATLGSIVWLARNAEVVPRIDAGLVLACAGDRGPSTYKRSRGGASLTDRAAERVLRESGAPYDIQDFVPYGYDERQYCSPGFDLPVGRLTRTPNGEYPEYHTSADDISILHADSLVDTLEKADRILTIAEQDRSYLNLLPRGEPQLGKRGLYQGLAGGTSLPDYELALLWVLNQSDGSNSLLDISERSGIHFETIYGAAERLTSAGLLAQVDY